MSLIHRLIVGHFDLCTFVSHHPVALRSLDAERTREMLSKIGNKTSDTEYEIAGEALRFVNGYCDCPWLSNRHNADSEAFARSVAELEDCFLIEKGAGTILHPVRSIQAAPRGFSDVRMDRPLTLDESLACLQADDPEVLRYAVLRAAKNDGEWVEPFCLSLARHRHLHVRGNALFALTMLASRRAKLTRSIVQPLIEKALVDPDLYVSGHADLVAETVELKLMWLIYSFDNGQPPVDVTTYSNGWVRCPSCNLRFSTHDPWAFREGRCFRCRQQLRVRTETS